MSRFDLYNKSIIPQTSDISFEKAGILTCSGIVAPSHLSAMTYCDRLLVELTAAGTVTDFHRIPYYCQEVDSSTSINDNFFGAKLKNNFIYSVHAQYFCKKIDNLLSTGKCKISDL